MKLKFCAVAVWLAAVLGAGAAPAKPKLEDIISDSRYLKEALGPKVLLGTQPKTGEVAAELIAAIKCAKLDEGTRFYSLPKDATLPEPKSRPAPTYPTNLRQTGVSGQARFLFLIGPDGAVKGIYCFESTHPAFALAGAGAVVKWRFTPAMVENTPVPLLVSQTVEFNTTIR